MDALFSPLATALGASVDQLKVIFCLLLSYPLASLYNRLHRPNYKHIFSIVVSLFYLIPVFQLWNGTLQLIGSILATYFITANINGRKMPWITFGIVMGHLTLNHIYRAFFDISLSTFEITGPQMVLTMKLSTYAWNVYDGRQPLESLDKWQLEKRVVNIPTLLEFFGYVFYFPGMLVGPFLEYADYSSLVKDASRSLSENKDDKAGRHSTVSGRKRAAYKKMVQGLIYLGLFVLYGGSFNYSVILDDWWTKKSWWYQIGYIQAIGFFERAKYYALWSLTEGAAIATGFGFTGYTSTGLGKWEGAANVRVSMIEWPSNFKVLLDSWNIKTNIWLRECIYKRVTPAGKKPGFRSSMLTFATSAFWHGFAGGYYMTFILGGFIQTAQRYVRTLVRPLFLPPVVLSATGAKATPPSSPVKPAFIKRLYDVMGTLTSIALVNYVAVPHILLEVRLAVTGWSRVHWYGHIIVGGGLVFFWGGGAAWLKRVQQRRIQKVTVIQMPVDISGAKGNGNSTQPSTPGSHVIAPVDLVASKVAESLK